jgi:hypothetical protein
MRKVNLQELVQELKRQNLKKRDLIVPSRCLGMKGGALIINNVDDNAGLADILRGTGISTDSGGQSLALIGSDTCHNHIAEKLGIPKTYYERMANGNVELLDRNVNYWLENEQKNYMIRSFVDGEEKTGIARAMLSDSFLCLDNFDVLMTVLEAVKESGINLQMDADVTEKRMYVRFTAPDIEVEARELVKNYRVPGQNDGGDFGICAGFVVGNSEVGHGQFFVAPRLVVKVCNNGMIGMDEAFKRVHVGSKLSEYSFIKWSEGTQQKNIDLVISQVRDALKTFLTPEYIGGKIRELSIKAGLKLEHPIDAVKNVSREYKFSQEKEKAILDYFFQSSDNSRFGLVQAVTFYAHKNADADDQYEMESLVPVLIENMDKHDRPFVENNRK